MSSSDSDVVDNPMEMESTPKKRIRRSFYAGVSAAKVPRCLKQEFNRGSSPSSMDDSDDDPNYKEETSFSSIATPESEPKKKIMAAKKKKASVSPVPGPSGIGIRHGGRPSVSEGVGEDIGGDGGEGDVGEGDVGGEIVATVEGKGKVEKKGRKRVRQVEKWGKNVAKSRRNKGLEYTSYATKKTVAGRKQGPPCPDGCFARIGAEACAEIYKSCWEIGSYDARLQYYNSCVSERKFKRKYTKKDTSLRPMQICYQVRHGGTVHDICKAGFISIHGMTKKEIEYFLWKRKHSSTGNIPTDQRGKHPSGRKITGVALDLIHQHIQSVPVTTSHYSRIKNPHRQYAQEGLTIGRLYSEYQSWMLENHDESLIVKESFYKHIFTTEYNIAFQHPKTDVCNLCTAFSLQIKELNDPDELEDAQLQFKQHTDSAHKATDLLRAAADDSDDDVMVIAVDLQQTLQCPKMAVNRAYYTRKLWLYNLCIYDVKRKRPHLFLWVESEGGRGADDICSCIHKWLEIHANGRKKLKIYADNCAAQNKNKTIVLMALRKIHEQSLSRVDFIYMVSGHSFLPCDRIFGIIEKQIRRVSCLTSPDAYISHIKLSMKKDFDITVMHSGDFLSFSALQNYCKWRTPGGPLTGSFRKARQIVVSDAFPAGYLLKLHYDQHENVGTFMKVMLTEKGPGKGRGKGRGRPARRSEAVLLDFDLSVAEIPLRYPAGGILINRDKMNDLQLLLPYLDPPGKAWVNRLQGQQTTLSNAGITATDIVEEEDHDNPAPEDDAMDYEQPRRVPQQ